MKYIDVDKLKEEIERLYDGEAPKHDQQCDFNDGYFMGISVISNLIDSLQQEQDILVINKKDWEEQEKFLKNKKFGVPLQQEQPEVDFKIEERKWVHDAVDNIFPEDGDFMSEVDFRKILKDTALHFYELGLKSK